MYTDFSVKKQRKFDVPHGLIPSPSWASHMNYLRTLFLNEIISLVGGNISLSGIIFHNLDGRCKNKVWKRSVGTDQRYI